MILIIGRLLTNNDEINSFQKTLSIVDDIKKSDIENLIKEKFPKEYSEVIFNN